MYFRKEGSFFPKNNANKGNSMLCSPFCRNTKNFRAPLRVEPGLFYWPLLAAAAVTVMSQKNVVVMINVIGHGNFMSKSI